MAERRGHNYYQELTELTSKEEVEKQSLDAHFLEKLFSGKRFERELNAHYRRCDQTLAEGGFIVYKQINGEKYALVRRYGMKQVDAGDPSWGFVSKKYPHVSLDDDLTYKEKGYVRVGDFHIHPYGASTFGSGDLNSYEEYTLGYMSGFHEVPRLEEAFMLGGGIKQHPEKYLELFGISLPLNGLLDNRYQYVMQNERPETHDEILQDCGFRVVRTKVPIVKGRVSVCEENIRELVRLAESS